MLPKLSSLLILYFSLPLTEMYKPKIDMKLKSPPPSLHTSKQSAPVDSAPKFLSRSSVSKLQLSLL